jgi:hypothetical protein
VHPARHCSVSVPLMQKGASGSLTFRSASITRITGQSFDTTWKHVPFPWAYGVELPRAGIGMLCIIQSSLGSPTYKAR